MEVGDVVIGCWAGGTVGVSERIGRPWGIVGKVQNLCGDGSVRCCGGNGLPQEPSAGIDVAVLLRDGADQYHGWAAGCGGNFFAGSQFQILWILFSCGRLILQGHEVARVGGKGGNWCARSIYPPGW